jgi:S-adenosylmethionine decarboxylase proenzyme
LVEYHRCDPNVLNDLERLRECMLEAANRCGATVLEDSFHYFSPQGVSGVVVIAESHIAIHTWPEYKYAAVDIFTCGTTVDPWIAFRHLEQGLYSTECSVREIIRGEFSSLKSQIRQRSV